MVKKIGGLLSEELLTFVVTILKWTTRT